MKKVKHHHVRHVYRGISMALIALVGFIFIVEIMRAHSEVAYRTEEARLLEERYIFSAP
jgi:hypothetical protein